MQDCEAYIYSEDYADYILPYYGDISTIEENYQPDCIRDLGGGIVVVFRKGTYEDGPSGYGAIPKCYGLLDTSNIESTGTGRVRRQPYLGFRGSGVLIGILDTGERVMFMSVSMRLTPKWLKYNNFYTIHPTSKEVSFLYIHLYKFFLDKSFFSDIMKNE